MPTPPDPEITEQRRFDLIALGLLTLSGLAALTLELRAILGGVSSLWAGSRLAGLPLVSCVVFAILFAVSLFVARRIGKVWAIFCSMPFLVMATLPLLASAPVEGSVSLRTTVRPMELPVPVTDDGNVRVAVPGAAREDDCHLISPEGDLLDDYLGLRTGYDPERGWAVYGNEDPGIRRITVTCMRLSLN